MAATSTNSSAPQFPLETHLEDAEWLNFVSRTVLLKLETVNTERVDNTKLGGFDGFYWWVFEVPEETGSNVDYVSHSNNANLTVGEPLDGQCGTEIRGLLDIEAGTNGFNIRPNTVPRSGILDDTPMIECSPGLTVDYQYLLDSRFDLTVTTDQAKIKTEAGDTASFSILSYTVDQ